MSRSLRIIYAGAFAGYDSITNPLGGAATVYNQLVQEWSARSDIELILIGSGEGTRYDNIKYIKLPGPVPDLVNLSMKEYAHFSYRFEKFVTETVMDFVDSNGAENTCFISNDIAEAGDFLLIHQSGIPIVTIYHTDIVEYFAKIFMKNLISPEKLTAFFGQAMRGPFRMLIPRPLKQLFKKQQESLLYSQAVVVPSESLKKGLLRCNPALLPECIHVIPWGILPRNTTSEEREAQALSLVNKYKIAPSDKVLCTLSRISPQKGLDLFLKALIMWENEGGGDGVHLFICGEATYLQGENSKKKLFQLVNRLKRVKVHFPGYVTGLTKAGFFELADLYIFPSRWESYGISLVEAMQAGLPVLTSAHHSAAELVQQEWGRVVEWDRESEAPRNLLVALQELLANPESLSVMGQRAAEASKNWLFENAAESMLNLVKTLVSKGKQVDICTHHAPRTIVDSK